MHVCVVVVVVVVGGGLIKGRRCGGWGSDQEADGAPTKGRAAGREQGGSRCVAEGKAVEGHTVGGRPQSWPSPP